MRYMLYLLSLFTFKIFLSIFKWIHERNFIKVKAHYSDTNHAAPAWKNPTELRCNLLHPLKATYLNYCLENTVSFIKLKIRFLVSQVISSWWQFGNVAGRRYKPKMKKAVYVDAMQTVVLNKIYSGSWIDTNMKGIKNDINLKKSVFSHFSIKKNEVGVRGSSKCFNNIHEFVFWYLFSIWWMLK